MPTRRSLPTGTLTFLFTDIEGSTGLAGTLPDRWPALLERHRAIIRAALAASGGVEVQTEGDGFFAVFVSANGGVNAAVRAQLDLAAEPWPPDASIRVRMGLHTGEAALDADGSYVGHDVHRAARLSAAGHGGQVLISETTGALVAGALPSGVTMRDLGEHRLKDLRPQHISQLVIAGLTSDFPTLRSLDARPNNLPLQLTSFIGRDREIADAGGLLAATRLLTITGPGGTGKTRLALQLAADVADRFADGVWFVALEPLHDPQLVLATVAHTMGVVPRPGQSAIDALAASLGDRRVLLLLDNMEQVIDAAGDVAALLRACPGVTVIVTSRAVLRIAGEQEFVVPGLPAPPDTSVMSRVELERLPARLRRPDPATLDQYEAVRLFIVRASSTSPGFAVNAQNAPAIAGITSRLHGMPLAIELAAARVKLLSPEQILSRLERQLGFLTSAARDLPDRQRTLRGAIAWSYDLLDDDHRRLLGTLSIFRGGWDLAAAEAIAERSGAGVRIDTLEGLSDLVDQSLVRRSDEVDGVVRFSMLESIGEYAAEMLDDADRVSAAHAAYYLAVAEEAAPELQGSEQRTWLDRLERDHDNLRAAFAWSLSRPDASDAVRLAFALWRFWQQRGYLDEARRDVDRLEERIGGLTADTRARFAEAAGGVAYWQADFAATTRWYDQALAIRRELADPDDPASQRELANALYNRGFASVALTMGAVADGGPPDATAQDLMEESLAIYRAQGDAAGEANLLWGLGGYRLFLGEAAAAEEDFERAIELHRDSGQRTMEAWSLHMLGVARVMQGRVSDAGDAARHALRHFNEGGDLGGITLAVDLLAVVAVDAGERPRGGRLWGAARHLQETSGTGLAEWDEGVYAKLLIGIRNAFEEPVLQKLAAEGASLPLEDAVAYALGETDPFDR
jgi:predicted ATPase/class 3 adenylate cyclase